MMEEQQTQESDVTSQDSSATLDSINETSERPEWLPEKFNTPEDLANSYNSLAAKLGEKEDSLREKLLAELREEASEGVPETAGGYELPDFVDVEEAVDNELLKSWAEHCHENGYTHQEFQKGLELYAEAMGPMPDLDAEAARLGENSEARIEAASLFANQFFNEETLPAIEKLCETAEGIFALEQIMDAIKGPSTSEQTSVAANFNEIELREMQKDPRYWDAARRDPAFVKRVDDGYQRLHNRT